MKCSNGWPILMDGKMKKRDRFRSLAAILMLLALVAVVSLIPNEDNIADAAAKPITTKNIKTLDEALKAGVPVIVKLGSDKCLPCRKMNPIMQELAVEQNGKAVFLKLEVYENRALAKAVGVRLIPTVLFYNKHGKLKAKHEGGLSKMELLKAIPDLELNK